MTFQASMQETVQSGLLELYDFTRGTDIQRYTTWQEEVSFSGYPYTPAPISRSPISLDEAFKSVKVEINAPVTDPVASYIANSPVEPVRVRITQAFVTDLTAAEVIFEGSIKSISLKNKFAKVVCESVSKVFRLKLPNVVYQAFCNHRLFDSGCAVNPALWNVQTAVTVSGSVLFSADFGTKPDKWFRGGHVLYGSDMRLITDHVGANITLQVPFDSRVADGTVVTAYAGCDKSHLTCLNTFNNLDNFLGMPYIPSSNPVIWGFK